MASAKKHRDRSKYRHFNGVPTWLFEMKARERKELKLQREKFNNILKSVDVIEKEEE